MTGRIGLLGLLAVVLAFGLTGAAAGAGGKSSGSLDVYTGVVSADKAAELARQGYDVAAARQAAGGVRVDLVLTSGEAAKLSAKGVELHLKRDKQGRTQAQRAALQVEGGYNVYRSYDERGGIRDELYSIARRNSGIVKLEVIGKTLQGARSSRSR